MRRNKFKSVRRFERLEDRRLMAADIDVENDILQIEGTNNGDEIVITINPDDSDEVLIRIKDRATGQILEEADKDIDDFNEIEVHALGGNDVVRNFTDIRAKLFGEAGDDDLGSRGGNDLLDGGANNDTLEGGRGDDVLTGGTGSDTYRFIGSQLGNDDVNEAANVDVDKLDFTGFSAGSVGLDLAVTNEQVLNAGDLTLQLSSSTGIENVDGTLSPDTIRGNGRDNVLKGLGGGDTLYGRAGADDLFGGDANDFLYGEAGLDELFGEAGDDDLFGGSDRDILRGGVGNDDLFGEAGNDDLFGEAGVDNLNGGADSDYLDGGFFSSLIQSPRDQLTGGSGADTFVSHKSRFNRGNVYEDILDLQAIDTVLTVWH